MDLQNNYTMVTEFILLGFTDEPNLQIVLFFLFLAIYLFTVTGSLGLIVLIRIDSHFHTPMYFFLLHLSFTDLCYVSVIAPKMLVNFLVDHKSISYAGCVLQLFLFTALVTTECFLLAVMAIDRYMAICNPLMYPVLMSQELCNCLVAGSYAAGVANAVLQTVCIFRLSYCRCNILKHFFCDIPKLLQLSCSETHLSESLSVFASGIVAMTSISVIIISYLLALLYGTGTFTYIHPNLKSGQDIDMVISLIYTLIIPMLNPLIYSLRNKEVKEAIRKVTTS
uniref:Olfactory receptor n=1 Tax=Naja naja TaxID=35670 RepID=A0A8C6Y7Z9_NAJNA